MSLKEKAKLGFPVPQIFIDGKVDLHLINRVAEHADRFKFDSLWVQEQQIGTAPSLEPLTLLSSLANKTQNVKLGVSVLVMARHDPIQLAKQVASLDHLSAGRLILGLGAGSKDVSPGITGVQKDRRLLRLTEGLNVMKSLWTSSESNFQGKLWDLEKVSMSPLPLQKPHPPVWFGARAEPAISRAVLHGDGWMGAGSSSFTEFKEQIQLVRMMLEKHGRDPATFPISKRVYIAFDDRPEKAEGKIRNWFGEYYKNQDLGSKVSIWGPEEIVVEQLEEIADSGAEMLLVCPVYDFENHQKALTEIWNLG